DTEPGRRPGIGAVAGNPARGTDRRVRVSARARRRRVDRAGPVAGRGGGLSATARAKSPSTRPGCPRRCPWAAARGARRTTRRRGGGRRFGGGRASDITTDAMVGGAHRTGGRGPAARRAGSFEP